MNKENIQRSLESRKIDHSINILEPGELSPKHTASAMIDLLQSVYSKHAISNNKKQVITDIEDGRLVTWLAKKDDKFVATSSLIAQAGDYVEIGRAVSNTKGVGGVLMDLAVLHHLHTSSKPLIAEVRLADEFKGIPGSEATQHICFDKFELNPHAVAPFFEHGNRPRRESFVLSRSDIKRLSSISGVVHETISGRSFGGNESRLLMTQKEPFQVVQDSNDGMQIEDFWKKNNMLNNPTFTLFPIEAIDQNMALIGQLLQNPRCVICGLDSNLGKSGKPIILLGHVGLDTKIAPSKVSANLPILMKRDIQTIADKFTSLGNQNLDRFGEWPNGSWIDRKGVIWTDQS